MTIVRWMVACVLVCGAIVLAATDHLVADRSPSREAAGGLRWTMSAHAGGPGGSGRPARVATLDPDTLIQDYCVDCHNDVTKAGGQTFETFVIADTAKRADMAERMVRKLRAGMMPPPGATPPDAASLQALVDVLETRLDAAAAANPNPGRRVFPRLNRAEYARSIRELFGLDVDPGQWLPLDTMNANFDNIADEQMLSATLLEAYLNAAGEISRMAVGDRTAASLDRTYANSTYASQHPWDHVDGAPFGTRGGMAVTHVFPADGEYVLQVNLTGGANSRLEDIDVSVDGERVALIKYETQPNESQDGRGAIPMRTDPIVIRAGQRLVAAAFVRRTDGPYEDLVRPHDWSFAGAGTGGAGVTTLPHVRDLVVRGPGRVTGLSETPARRRIFTCRPTGPGDDKACARSIVARMGAAAYRRPLEPTEVDALMQFYASGRQRGGFELGVREALEAVLASPHFIFRLERQPGRVKPGEVYRIGDFELASRLSFFLWGAPPDEALRTAAAQGSLSTPGGLDRIARQMLADPRAEALGERFAAQWFRLQDIDKVHPDPNFFPNFDDLLARDMRHETILFFNDLVRRNASALDIYRADYTFLNERLARHYSIPGVAGSHFRRVSYPDDRRRGVFGQGSVLVQTSMANRTSPVLRGKWVMEVLMGTPPPPPAPNVPPLENTAAAAKGKVLSTRERMEMHRSDPQCRSCHLFMDPIGLALDNFDVIARWRVRENGVALDTRGNFYDGTPVA
ncbi:MAG: DUF1592 domain-containing protein, partial [Acidobacteria bacterium]|nr:DUF1592 domain-containing protein [Acidobacteriota bacterium]